jgi:hypothetical protein
MNIRVDREKSMYERIDRFIHEIDLEVNKFLRATSDWENFAAVKEFVNRKRQAFINALNDARPNLIELFEHFEGSTVNVVVSNNMARFMDDFVNEKRPVEKKYFFRYQLDSYAPNPTDYKHFLGYLYIVKDGHIDLHMYDLARMLTSEVFAYFQKDNSQNKVYLGF